MLAARTSGAFVCLRCQLRLARPSPSFLRPIPASASHASFTSASRPDHSAEKDQPIERPVEPAKRNPSPLWSIKRRKIYSVPVTEEVEPLGVKALGSDAEILVLRERLELSQEIDGEPATAEHHKNQNTSAATISSQLVASISEDNVRLGQEEVNRQIETLRPESLSGKDEPNYLTQSEFIKLNRLLYSSFTSQQLSRYLSASTGVRSERMRQEVLQELIKESEKNRKPSHQTDWRPGITALSNRLPSVARMQRNKASLSKLQLVDQIIRFAWNVVLLDEIETTGELEISLKRWQLSILHSGDAPTLLDRIQQQRGAKIEIYWPKHTLRITADKNSAEYAAEDIKRSLSEVNSETFELTPWVPFLTQRKTPIERLAQVLSQDDLQTVEKLSGAALQASKADTLVIRGPTQKQVDDAKRHLLAMLPMKPTFSRSIRTTASREEVSKGYMRPSLFTDSLPYSFRRLQLGRWSLPVASANPDISASASNSLSAEETRSPHLPSKYGGVVTTKLQTGIRNRVVKELLRFEDSTVPVSEKADVEDMKPMDPQAQSFWSPKPETEVSAEFGQALFPLNISNPTQAVNMPSVFTGILPGLPKFLFDVKWAEPGSASAVQTLAYHFIPSPKNSNEKAPQRYPNLVVLINLASTGDIEVQGVGLSVDEHIIDVLIPDWASDIRYRRVKRAWLQNPELDENLRSFVESVRANILSRERLTAPPTLQLEIPRWTIKGSEPSNQEPDRRTKAEYVFTGIEHRQTATVDFEGRNLRYTGQQGGQLAGKDGVLELYYGPISDNQDVEWTALSRYFESTFRISRRINEAAANSRHLETLQKHRREKERIVELARSNPPVKEAGDEVIPFENGEHVSPDDQGLSEGWMDNEHMLGDSSGPFPVKVDAGEDQPGRKEGFLT